MTNLNALDVTSLTLSYPTQAMTADGAITITEGVVTLSKGAALLATLGSPTAGVDDHKRLTIIALTAQAHTVTSVAGALVATYSGAIGATLDLIAYNGRWEIVGSHNVTCA